eukprot:13518885-Alexandrium_andersonii.AAC.1
MENALQILIHRARGGHKAGMLPDLLVLETPSKLAPRGPGAPLGVFSAKIGYTSLCFAADFCRRRLRRHECTSML